MSSKTKGKEDDGCLSLEQFLDKFYDIDNGPASKKAQKKKKRKRCKEEEEEFAPVKDTCSDSEDNRAALAGTEHQQQQQKTEKTGATARQTNQVEVVTFQDPRKKPRTKQTPATDKTPVVQVTEKKQSNQEEEIDFEKARLEVHRFGITGYKKDQQRVFEQDRAIMLGARPPKKGYVNYKELQQQIREKKQKAKEEVQPDLKKKKKQNNQRDKKKVSSGSSSAPTGQVGRFKNGMLILSSKEVQNIKGNKGRR